MNKEHIIIVENKKMRTASEKSLFYRYSHVNLRFANQDVLITNDQRSAIVKWKGTLLLSERTMF